MSTLPQKGCRLLYEVEALMWRGKHKRPMITLFLALASEPIYGRITVCRLSTTPGVVLLFILWVD